MHLSMGTQVYVSGHRRSEGRYWPYECRNKKRKHLVSALVCQTPNICCKTRRKKRGKKQMASWVLSCVSFRGLLIVTQSQTNTHALLWPQCKQANASAQISAFLQTQSSHFYRRQKFSDRLHVRTRTDYVALVQYLVKREAAPWKSHHYWQDSSVIILRWKLCVLFLQDRQHGNEGPCGTCK